MIEVKNLSFAYGTQAVLRDVSFRVEAGSFLSVLGANGVGKSTLFSCMLGLHRPQKGEITLDGEPLLSFSPKELAKRIAYIPQSHHPVFNYSVLEMALMGASAQLGSFSVPGKPQQRAAEEALERLGIAHLAERGYGQLSGGERQLTLIARALVQNAKILIMDEPSASLDFGNRVRVMQTVRSLTAQGYTVIQSTHDPEQAYAYSDRVLALHQGRVLAFGTPQEVIAGEQMSVLYGIPIEVYTFRQNSTCVCVPKGDRQ